MSKADVSGRTVLDCYGRKLSPGDIVIVSAATTSSLTTAVFLSHFDNGSGWKARFRQPSHGNRQKSYNPTTMKGGSYALNSDIVEVRYWHNKKKIADDAKERCVGVLKIESDIKCDAYNNAKKLRAVMIANGDIKVLTNEAVSNPNNQADIIDQSGELSEESSVDFGSILSTLGAPKIGS